MEFKEELELLLNNFLITKENNKEAYYKIKSKIKKQYKLTNEQVAEIKSLYIGKTGVNQHTKTGMSYSDIAKKYGVTRGLIASIIRGEIRNENSYKLK